MGAVAPKTTHLWVLLLARQTDAIVHCHSRATQSPTFATLTIWMQPQGIFQWNNSTRVYLCGKEAPASIACIHCYLEPCQWLVKVLWVVDAADQLLPEVLCILVQQGPAAGGG